ncbi:hypothetical protein ABTM30_19735, partial [Acinetobacter baumannii]
VPLDRQQRFLAGARTQAPFRLARSLGTIYLTQNPSLDFNTAPAAIQRPGFGAHSRMSRLQHFVLVKQIERDLPPLNLKGVAHN